MLNNHFRELRYLIITHTYGTGQAQELEKYLIKNKVNLLVFVGIPFPFSNTEEGPSATVYNNGVLTNKIVLSKISLLGVLRFIYEGFLTVYLALRVGRRFDVAYCANNLNAFIGIFLRGIGVVKFVVFNTVDYVPKRFKNVHLNKLYHFIDKLSCYYADSIWNLASIMSEEREKIGIFKRGMAPQIVVPMGNNFSRIKRLNFNEIERHTVVFMGHLLEKAGVQLMIETVPSLIGCIPDFKFLVLGGGEYLEKLKGFANKLGVNSYVQFKGFVKEHSEIEDILTKCSVGVALYVDDPDDYTRYTDQGKLKAYMACGLPIIVTSVPQIAYEIDRRKAGIAINYDKDQLREALIKLLTNDNFYKEYRRNAIGFAGEFEWEKVFDKAFCDTFEYY